jgi:RNA polymerase sigma-70 factor (ECF subfamily)
MDFWEIYDTHYRPVRTFISKMVGDEWAADDLTQDTFLKVQESLHGLKDPSKLRPWIFQIARNRCLDYFRGGAAKGAGLKAARGLMGPIEPVAQMQLEQHQMSRCVQEKIHMLPEPLRVVLVLSDTMELRNQEIADILEIKVGNVKVRLHRARKALKEILKRDCTFEHDERNVMVCLPKSMTGNSKEKPVMCEKQQPWKRLKK